jgi:hypothetical protein
LTGPRFPQWTSSPAGIHVSHSQQQDLEKGKTMSDIYGHLFGMPFARWDQDTQSWKTSEDTCLLDLPMSSLILPKSGLMRNGQLYQRPTLERPIDENDFSSLPTPTDWDSRWYAEPVKHRPNDKDLLHRAIGHLLPTPVADHSRGLPQKGTDFQSLPNVAISLLPTPTVNDMGAGKDPQKWQEWTEEMRQKHGNGNGHGRSLEQEALQIGNSTNQPSDDGKTSLDDQHQNPQLWDATDDPA